MSVSVSSSVEAQIAARTLALQGAAAQALQGQAGASASDLSGAKTPEVQPSASASSTQVDLSPGLTGASAGGSNAAVAKLADKYSANGIDSDGAGLLALQLQQQLSTSPHALANAAPQMILNLFKS